MSNTETHMNTIAYDTMERTVDWTNLFRNQLQRLFFIEEIHLIQLAFLGGGRGWAGGGHLNY